jgi:two-component system, cell cycle sensor histidine kinase and response regulator CckA
MIEYILFISVLLQVVAAVLALRLMRFTELRAAWILIAVGLVLMAVGRIIDILPFFAIKITPDIKWLNEWVDVFISIVMLAGVALIAPLFYSIRQSENALREAEEQYRLLIETMNEGLGMVDNKGIRTFVNRKFCEMTGYPKEELIGYPAAKLYVEEENQKIFQEQRIKREKGEDDPYEIVITHKDGNKIQVLVSPKPVYDKDGQYVGSIAIFTDITDRKKAEEKLKESEQRLHRVIEGSPIPTFVIGKDHRVIYWNRALEELSGIKAEIVGTKGQWRAFYNEERPCLADLLVDQALESIPQWYLDKYTKSRLVDEAYEATDFFPELGESGKWLHFTAAVIRDTHGNLVGAIETLDDVTDRRRAEEELSRVNKLESLGIFASGIAHDFNNLVSVMLRNIFAAKLSLPDEQQELLGEGLEIAEKVGHQAKELAHRLMTFAKGGEPVRKIGSISKLLTDSVDLPLSGSNVICESSLPDNLWPVEMDDVQIRQVIHNLLINAREAMHDVGIITIRAENVNISAGDGLPLKEGSYVKWSIRDHGAGISKENLPKIFDPYFTTKPTGSARGMGLGLAVCYSIIKKHDGFITVESEPGMGSTVIVYLPASPQLDSSGKGATEQVIARKGKVLVMDDDEAVRNSTGIVLNYLGYDVEYAKNGGEAVDLYKIAVEKGQPFYAVVLGLNMPEGMGGKETLQELYAIDPQVKSIISCGYSDDPLVSKFKENEFCWRVDVPYDIEKMKAILDNLPK